MEPENKKVKLTPCVLSETVPIVVGPFAHGRSWGRRAVPLVPTSESEEMFHLWSSHDFYVKRTVGCGHFGEVFEALTTSGPNQTNVALKRIAKRRIIEGLVKRNTHPLQLLQQEVQIHSSIGHKNIVPLHGFYENPENVFLVLDLAPHGDVAQWIRKSPEGRFFTAPIVVASVADALSYLHQRGIAHRDIKPENVLVFGPTDFRLGDFGWACTGTSTRSTLAGTPEFLAPEVVACRYDKSKSYDASGADLWALGVLMYDLVEGRTPFAYDESREKEWLDRGDARSAAEIIFAKIREFEEPVAVTPFDAVSDLRGEAVQDFCSQLMKVSPATRMKADEALQHCVLKPTREMIERTVVPVDEMLLL